MRLTGALGVWKRTGYLMFSFVLVLACADHKRTIDAVATDSLSLVGLDDDVEKPVQVQHNSDDPFLVFGMQPSVDALATIVSTDVWLVNHSRVSIIITAAGGAETVLVDTLAATDSVRVTIETRADSVAISARTREGVSMGSIAVPMDSKPRRAAFPQ